MQNFFSKIIIITFFLIAKEILIFNEEILIVVAFFSFIFLLTQYASEIISKELNDKAILIQNKFEIYKNIQEKTIVHLLSYHSKREELSLKIKTISKIKKFRINIITQFYKTNINKKILLQVEDTLNRFILNDYIGSILFQQKFLYKLQNIKLNLILNEK